MKRSYNNYRDLILVLTEKEMKVRYKNSILGYFWSVIHPLTFGLVFFVAFKIVMKFPMKDYALFLIVGLFPWQWFSNSISASPLVFLANASIIKKINFPRHIIPLTIVLQDMIHFLLSIPVILLFMLIYHKAPHISWLYTLPILLLNQFFLTYGFALIISSVNLFFRDLERLTVILLTLIFYFTPIIYPENMIPDKYKLFINLNPLSPLMVSWRNMFLYGNININYFLMSAIYSLTIFYIGFLVYQKLSWRFAEVL